MKIQLGAWGQDIGWRDSVRIGVSRLTALAANRFGEGAANAVWSYHRSEGKYSAARRWWTHK